MDTPLITCACSFKTTSTYKILQRSIICFLNQTYPNKELFIVYQDDVFSNDIISELKHYFKIQSNIHFVIGKINLKDVLKQMFQLANGELMYWSSRDISDSKKN